MSKRDIIENELIYLPLNKILAKRLVSKKYKDIIDSSQFWGRMIKKDFPNFFGLCNSYRNLYRQLYIMRKEERWVGEIKSDLYFLYKLDTDIRSDRSKLLEYNSKKITLLFKIIEENELKFEFPESIRRNVIFNVFTKLKDEDSIYAVYREILEIEDPYDSTSIYLSDLFKRNNYGTKNIEKFLRSYTFYKDDYDGFFEYADGLYFNPKYPELKKALTNIKNDKKFWSKIKKYKSKWEIEYEKRRRSEDLSDSEEDYE